MKRLLFVIGFVLALLVPARAQTPVTVTGPVTPGNCTAFSSITILKDAGAPCGAGGSGVVSVGGMNGTIVCATSLTCMPILSVNTIGCTIATTSQLGCVIPDGVTIMVNGSGVVSAVGSAASAITVGTTNVVSCSNSGYILYNNAGVLGCEANPGTGRTMLTMATSFYVSTGGTDAPACGTQASPCATRGYLYGQLQQKYDLGGQTVTVLLGSGTGGGFTQSGTFTDSLQASGPLVGQTGGPGGLIFTGNCASGHTTDVVVRPSGGVGYVYSVISGAAYTIECQKVDQTTQLRAGNSNDMIVVGQSGQINFGKASLFGSYADMTIGCNINPYNDFTVFGGGAILVFYNDFNIDLSSCVETFTGTTTNGSNAINSVSSTTNVVNYMAIQGAGLPADAFISAIVGSSIAFSCVYTVPCQSSSSGGGVTFQVNGGAQTFIDAAQGGQVYFNTNGDPSFSIIATFTSGYYLTTAPIVFTNDIASVNIQGVTWVNPTLSRGKCAIAQTISSIDDAVGTYHIPCFAGGALAAENVTTTAGSNVVTVSPSIGSLAIGQVINDDAGPSCTWAAGSQTLACNSATDVFPGMSVLAPGILAGALVTNVVGTTISVGGCTTGPRCVSGFPTYLTESSPVTVLFQGHCLAPSTIIAISGTTLELNQAALATCSGNPGVVAASAPKYGVYQ